LLIGIRYITDSVAAPVGWLEHKNHISYNSVHSTSRWTYSLYYYCKLQCSN